MFSIQFDYSGNFRIVFTRPGRSVVPDEVITSEWFAYTSLANISIDGKTYVADRTRPGSAYGLLPKSETVYELSALITTVDKSKEWEDTHGRDMHDASGGCSLCASNEPCSYVGSETQKKTLAAKKEGLSTMELTRKT